MKTIHGASSFTLSNDLVSLHITQKGGHLAPVEFTLSGRVVSPYALAPWQPDEINAGLPVLLKNLRGDFFCLPFGPQTDGPPHGETANNDWKLVSESADSLELEMYATDVSGKITKNISLVPGQTAIYYEHSISGVEGNFNYGTHPILDLSGMEEGSARVSVSPFRWASVYPEWFSNPNDEAKQALRIGAVFGTHGGAAGGRWHNGSHPLPSAPGNGRSGDAGLR
jgi:hypothetical protein